MKSISRNRENTNFCLSFSQIALRFNNKAVAQIASDMVLLLADHVERLLEFYPEVPKKIVEVLARTLTSLIPSTTVDLENDEKRLLLALINCLGKIYKGEILRISYYEEFNSS